MKDAQNVVEPHEFNPREMRDCLNPPSHHYPSVGLLGKSPR